MTSWDGLVPGHVTVSVDSNLAHSTPPGSERNMVPLSGAAKTPPLHLSTSSANFTGESYDEI